MKIKSREKSAKGFFQIIPVNLRNPMVEAKGIKPIRPQKAAPMLARPVTTRPRL
jgi:hypothetical protein